MSCTEQAWIEIRKRALDVRQLGVDKDGAERHENPRPRPQHVVRDVEEEHRAERILFRLRRQHPLRDVTAAAGLGSRIPDRPPLHGHRHDEHGHRHIPVVGEIGQHRQIVDAVGPARDRQLVDEPGQAADLRRLQCEPRRRDDGGHLDEELNHVDDEHAPEPRVRGKDHVEDADAEERLPPLEAEEDSRDLAGGQVDRRHDHAVEQQAEVDGAEAADDARRRPRVADLVELEVSEHAGAPPQPGVEKHGRDAGEHERPPDPVAGDAVAPDDVGDEVGGVAAEGGGDHRKAGKPPRHRASRREELGGASPGAPREEQGRHEANEQRDAATITQSSGARTMARHCTSAISFQPSAFSHQLGAFAGRLTSPLGPVTLRIQRVPGPPASSSGVRGGWQPYCCWPGCRRLPSPMRQTTTCFVRLLARRRTPRPAGRLPAAADRQPHHCAICHSIRSFRTALSDCGPAAVSLTAEHGVDASADASRRAPCVRSAARSRTSRLITFSS